MDSPKFSESVYLDYNIIYGLTEGTVTANDVYSCIGKEIGVEFPYSDAHIFEISNIPDNYPDRDKIVQLRLDAINTISQGFSLWLNDADPDSIFYGDRNPYELFTIADADPFKKQMMRDVSNWIDESSRKSVRNWMGNDSKQVNNFNEEQVIEYLSKLTTQAKMTPMEFIQHSRKFYPHPETMGFHNDVAALFELLDILGYRKDKYHATSNYGRLWDAQHAAFAGYCHYFITSDKNTFHKAKIAYRLFSRQTRVVLLRSSN